MKTQELEVIDHTDGDADTVRGTVILHDLVGGHPSIIAYDWDIAETLEDIAGPLPEDYAHLPEEYATHWKTGNDMGKTYGYEGALGVRIEHFEDFLKEHSGIWTAPGGRTIQDEPSWTYPDDVDDIHENPGIKEDTMTVTIDFNDFSDILDLVKKRVEQWGEELHEQGWRGNVGLLLEGESDHGEWLAPIVKGGFDLERSIGDHAPIKYDPEYEYRDGVDDPEYPVNQIHELLLTYTGERPYWYNLILRIHPEDGVRLSVIG